MAPDDADAGPTDDDVGTPVVSDDDETRIGEIVAVEGPTTYVEPAEEAVDEVRNSLGWDDPHARYGVATNDLKPTSAEGSRAFRLEIDSTPKDEEA